MLLVWGFAGASVGELMAGLIVGKAYERGVGMCYVEHVSGELFRLIPVNSGLSRILKTRREIAWRRTKETA